jgi:hypothetical protein
MALQPDASAGVNTGSKLFILFMILFLLLNYSIFLSISLGAIAGLTGGFTAAWWNAKEDYITEIEEQEMKEAEEAEETASPTSARRERKGFGVVPATRIHKHRSGNWRFLRFTPRRKR